jgi:hypothetical protein
VDEEMSCGAKDERWERESSPNEWGIGGSEKCESSVTPGGKVEGFHGALTSDEVVGDPKETDWSLDWNEDTFVGLKYPLKRDFWGDGVLMRLFGEVTNDEEAGRFVTTVNIIVRLS